MSKKTKVITSNILPNPKEAEIWAKINKDGSREVKLYNNSTGKFECCGGSGSGSVDEFVYLDIRGLDLGSDMTYHNVIANSFLVYFKGEALGSYIDGVVTTATFFGAGLDATKISACAVCESCKILGPSGGCITILEMLELLHKEIYNSIPRITKEEFYNLEVTE